MDLIVGKCPTDALAVTNRLVIPAGTFNGKLTHIRFAGSTGDFYYTVIEDAAMPAGQIGFNAIQRQLTGITAGQSLRVNPVDVSRNTASEILFEVDFLRKNTVSKDSFDSDAMAGVVLETFVNTVFWTHEEFAFEFSKAPTTKVSFKLKVKKITTVDLLSGQSSTNNHLALLTSQTKLVFEASPASSIALVGKAKAGSGKKTIFDPAWNFNDMGIGGLDKEFSTMFRRAFASRCMPLDVVEKLGLKHVRGILLYGPPGTGKTLMARQIGKMLQGKEPKVVNGPEILNKYVGESEANIRNLFADAEAEYKKAGENSSLHIIIFDEMDAICKQRGTVSGGTGVQDSVVNQLLSKIDGVNSLNNILLIGMTNRIDLIDEALLRPGRLELKIQIALPDEPGRLQIFNIHTKKMKQNKVLGDDVDLEYLARITKNYSGAEIEGLVRCAISFATNRCINPTNMQNPNKAAIDDIKVTAEDFEAALKEVPPAFGVATEEFANLLKYDILEYQPKIKQILDNGRLAVELVQSSDRTPLVSLLLYGPSGCGKTALAAKIATDSGFPLVKLLSPETMVGYSESGKVNAITKVFEDAYKSKLSLIVVDDIERLLEYTPLGQRFSNIILQTLLVLLKKAPKQNHKLVIIVTASNYSILEMMGLTDVLSTSTHIPMITSTRHVVSLIKQGKPTDKNGLWFSDAELAQLEAELKGENLPNGAPVYIGVKKLFLLAEMAIQDTGNKASKFIGSLEEECLKMQR